MHQVSKASVACAVLLWTAGAARMAEGQSVEVPGIARIESNVPVAPP